MTHPRPDASPAQPPAGEDPWLTVDEVARFLRVSKMTVHRLLEDRELAYARIRSSIRIRRSALAQYLRTHRASELLITAAVTPLWAASVLGWAITLAGYWATGVLR